MRSGSIELGLELLGPKAMPLVSKIKTMESRIRLLLQDVEIWYLAGYGWRMALAERLPWVVGVKKI
jgi:hypothetical protein